MKMSIPIVESFSFWYIGLSFQFPQQRSPKANEQTQLPDETFKQLN